jgi:response regulator RpfG family c-di-GMP phosphodiesterase
MADNDSARVTTVLVAEDDPATLEVETISLEDEGFTVVPAKNGEDAWCLAQQEQPQVIVLDVRVTDQSARRAEAPNGPRAESPHPYSISNSRASWHR